MECTNTKPYFSPKNPDLIKPDMTKMTIFDKIAKDVPVPVQTRRPLIDCILILREEAIVVHSLSSLKFGINHLFSTLTPCLGIHPCVEDKSEESKK